MIGRTFRVAQILSLDIVIGAVILLRFFCAQMGVTPSWQVSVLLGGAIWLIYTADHLRDAEKSPKSTRERYRFHQRHKGKLTRACVLVFLCMIPFVLFVPIIVTLGGILLATLSFVYLLIQHRLSATFSKECYVALVYTLGILMVPMLLTQSFRFDLVLLLFLLTFLNLIIFSWFEKKDDEQDGFKSIATELEPKQLEKLILILLALGLSMTIINLSLVSLFFFVGFSIYACMVLRPSLFRKHAMYRVIGDSVFLLPILFEWL